MLEVLEQKLVEFTGTLILVSHDRAFYGQRGHTSTLVFEDNGDVVDYPGGFSDWVAQGVARYELLMHLRAEPAEPSATQAQKSKPVETKPTQKKRA